MIEKKLEKINELVKNKKIKEAEFELSKMGSDFFKNTEYLYLRGKIFFINKLYYMALDALLIATEFDKKDKVYNLIAEIYNVLGQKELSKKIYNPDLRVEAINSLKKQLTGISQKDS